MGGAHRRNHASVEDGLPKMYVFYFAPARFIEQLADGAALFYTTPQLPTLSVLRSYVLHFLFMAPFVQPGETTVPYKTPFPFNTRPNTLDRDRIVVPAGWDSWGKIGVLRDGFDAQRWGEAWDKDLEEGVVGTGGGAREMYRILVGGDEGSKVFASTLHLNARLTFAFSARHFQL
jgi:dynein light intermediate chain 1